MPFCLFLLLWVLFSPMTDWHLWNCEGNKEFLPVSCSTQTTCLSQQCLVGVPLNQMWIRFLFSTGPHASSVLSSHTPERKEFRWEIDPTVKHLGRASKETRVYSLGEEQVTVVHQWLIFYRGGTYRLFPWCPSLGQHFQEGLCFSRSPFYPNSVCYKQRYKICEYILGFKYP